MPRFDRRLEGATVVICPYCSLRIIEGKIVWGCDSDHPELFAILAEADKQVLENEYEGNKKTSHSI